MEVPQKKINKNRTTYNSTSGHIYEESSNSKRYMHPDVHSSTIYNSNLSSPSTDKWTKKKQYTYTTGDYSAIKKNEIMPFATTWMALERILLSEINQR